MGYSTGYYLDVHRGDLQIQDILEAVGEEFGGLYYAVDIDGDRLDDVKWYDHEKDMRELSIKYPETVFVLRGEGEENDDSWYKYFKNGKMQDCYAKITYDEYNENELR